MIGDQALDALGGDVDEGDVVADCCEGAAGCGADHPGPNHDDSFHGHPFGTSRRVDRPVLAQRLFTLAILPEPIGPSVCPFLDAASPSGIPQQ